MIIWRSVHRIICIFIGNVKGLKSVHLRIEVLICGHLKKVELRGDFGEAFARGELYLESVELLSFFWVGQSLEMSSTFFLSGTLSFGLFLFFIPVVSLLLVFVALERLPLRLFPGLIWLQFLHQLSRRRRWFVYRPPHWFWFVHKWISQWHLHFSLDAGVRNTIAILLRQLEYLVTEPLFRRLVPLELLDVAIVPEEFSEHVRTPSNVVDVRGELGFALV